MQGFLDDKNYTKVPNSLIEELLTSKITGTQMDVILTVIRKTHGWHKVYDHISTSQIAVATGLPRTYIVKVIKRLCELKILLKIRDNFAGNMLRVNSYTEDWLCDKRVTIPQVTSQGVPEPTTQKSPSRQELDELQDTHKILKEIAEPATQTLISDIRKQHDFLQGGKYDSR